MEPTNKELEELERDIFYHMLKRADELDQDEKPIKFNYLNIVSKLKLGVEARTITNCIEYLNKKTEEMIYPFGDRHTHIRRYHPGGVEVYNETKTSEYYSHKETLPPQRFINSKHFIGGGACRKIKEAVRLDKKARGHIHSLFNLNKLEDYIKSIIEEIKNSDLRNYVNSHSTELFQEDVIFKIYRGQEQIDRIRIESAALNFFQKELPELPVPRIYCHGELSDFYVLLEEKIDGVTIDEYLRKSKSHKQKIRLLEQILDKVVKIGIEGYTNDIPTLYGKLTEKSLSEWLNTGIVNKLNTEKSKDLLQKIKYNYGVINKLLLDSPFLYNKDISTKNWLIKEDSDLCTIDFENTHFGPIQLDLVTLFEGRNGFGLKERELILALKEICEKINSYVKKKNKNLSEFKESDFIKAYFAASVHRNLSMAGTNKGQNNQKQTVKHLKRAMHSANKLQRIIKNEKEKESLQELSNNIYKLSLVIFDKD